MDLCSVASNGTVALLEVRCVCGVGTVVKGRYGITKHCAVKCSANDKKAKKVHHLTTQTP